MGLRGESSSFFWRVDMPSLRTVMRETRLTWTSSSAGLIKFPGRNLQPISAIELILKVKRFSSSIRPILLLCHWI